LVRIARDRNPFEKETQGGYSREIFQVIRVLETQPWTYWIADLMDERVLGSFYEFEMIKTNMPETFKIEKVLQEKRVGRKTMQLIKWLGWPDKFNSWIEKK